MLYVCSLICSNLRSVHARLVALSNVHPPARLLSLDILDPPSWLPGLDGLANAGYNKWIPHRYEASTRNPTVNYDYCQNATLELGRSHRIP